MLGIFMAVSLAACGAESSGSGKTVEDSSRTVAEEEITDMEPVEASGKENNDNILISVDVIPIGKVTSDLSVFEELGSSEEITFSLKE